MNLRFSTLMTLWNFLLGPKVLIVRATLFFNFLIAPPQKLRIFWHSLYTFLMENFVVCALFVHCLSNRKPTLNPERNNHQKQLSEIKASFSWHFVMRDAVKLLFTAPDIWLKLKARMVGKMVLEFKKKLMKSTIPVT